MSVSATRASIRSWHAWLFPWVIPWNITGVPNTSICIKIDMIDGPNLKHCVLWNWGSWPQMHWGYVIKMAADIRMVSTDTLCQRCAMLKTLGLIIGISFFSQFALPWSWSPLRIKWHYLLQPCHFKVPNIHQKWKNIQCKWSWSWTHESIFEFACRLFLRELPVPTLPATPSLNYIVYKLAWSKPQ